MTYRPQRINNKLRYLYTSRDLRLNEQLFLTQTARRFVVVYKVSTISAIEMAFTNMIQIALNTSLPAQRVIMNQEIYN